MKKFTRNAKDRISYLCFTASKAADSQTENQTAQTEPNVIANIYLDHKERAFTVILVGMHKAKDILPDEEAAVDIVQNAFLIPHRKNPAFYSLGEFRKYMWKTLKNEFSNWKRKEKRKQERFSSLEELPMAEQQKYEPLHSETPREALELQREREHLNQALNTLPERDQAVMQLYCDEWSYTVSNLNC